MLCILVDSMKHTVIPYLNVAPELKSIGQMSLLSCPNFALVIYLALCKLTNRLENERFYRIGNDYSTKSLLGLHLYNYCLFKVN